MTKISDRKRMNPEWQAKVESKLDNHDKDLHNIAGSLKGINQQMTRTNEILQDFALKDERFRSRLEALDSKLVSRIERNEDNTKRLQERLNKLDAGIARVLWTVGTFLILGVVGSVIKFGVYGA